MKNDKKRQVLFFVSLIGIIVVTLIMGTTYAYQSLIVDYKEGSDNELTINVGKLDVTYTTINKIELTNMPFLPDYKAADYVEFTIDNTKSTGDVGYYISLTDLTYDTGLATSSFKYTIVKMNEDETHTVLSNGNFANLNSTEILLNNTYYKIDKGLTETLRLYLWLDENGSSSITENTSFTGYIKIESLYFNDIQNKKLSDILMIDERIIKNTVTPIFNNVETTELGMYTAEDDYGESWYFRGAQTKNYVNFAGFTWRIVRINGDGSIRLILDGTLDKVYKTNTDQTVSSTAAGSISQINSAVNNNNYVGYMYGLNLTSNTNSNVFRCLKNSNGVVTDLYSTYSNKSACENAGGKWTTNSYEATHANVASSTIKTNVDLFYEKYLKADYEEYLADAIFCADKTPASNSTIGNNNSTLGYGTSSTFYMAIQRLYYSANKTLASIVEPTLECTKASIDNYSRYTVEAYETEKKVETNGDLTYPIGLLSADELIMAGAWRETRNHYYYLYDAHKDGKSSNFWWIMSPCCFAGSVTGLGNHVNYGLFGVGAGASNGVRPVINLNSDVLVTSGDGTKTTIKDSSGNIISGPYIVELANKL